MFSYVLRSIRLLGIDVTHVNQVAALFKALGGGEQTLASLSTLSRKAGVHRPRRRHYALFVQRLRLLRVTERGFSHCCEYRILLEPESDE